MEEFLDTIEKRGVVLNTAMLAPHGIIRLNVMGQEKRLAKPDEKSKMGKIVRQCMDAGALGLSTGLQYFPGSQSDTDELIDLAKVVNEYDGVFTSHLRSYSNTLEMAIDELKTVSRKADVPVQLSHMFWIPHVNDTIDPIVRKAAKLGSKIYNFIKLPIPLDAAVAELANTFASGPTDALAYTKRAIRRSLDRDMEAEFDYEIFAQVQCLQSKDHREGVTAFHERRPPKFER